MAERQSIKSSNNITSLFSVIENNAVAIGVVVVILMMFIPVPKILIDLSMVMNIAVGFIIMLTVLYTRSPANFSSFPRITLLVTMFGLAVNVSSTRLIITGNGDLAGQSEMVKSFARIATGGNLVVGFIIFIIITVVQVVVVTKGAGRVSEVQARFSLDSMNNKMFDIQQMVQTGEITAEEGAKRKNILRRENSFYSSMDGASKFVSGNVKAGIFITVINFIGGLVTGMVFGKLSAMEALQRYVTLTIGDGLMAQIPSILLSFGTGILVTGTANDDLIGEQIKKEFSLDGSIYLIVGLVLVVMGLAFHNGSAFVLIPTGLVIAGLGFNMIRKKNVKTIVSEEASKDGKTVGSESAATKPEEISPLVKLDDLSLEIGFQLVPLVSEEKGRELVERIRSIRKELALDLGLVIPAIRIVDQITLAPEEYSFKIRGVEVARGRLKIGHFMGLNTGSVNMESAIAKDHSLETTKDPAFGMNALWVPETRRFEAEKAGYTIIDLPTIVTTHLTETIRKNAATILTRQQVSKIVDVVKESNPIVVQEVFEGENRFTYGQIEQILKNLLEEQVSIQNMVTILETIGDYGKMGFTDLWMLTEKVREALGAQICSQYKDENNVLRVLNMSPALMEKILEKRAQVPGKKPFVAFDLTEARNYISAVSGAIAAVRRINVQPIILCADEVRILVKSSIERELAGVVVLSHSEVMAGGPSLKIESLGEINE